AVVASAASVAAAGSAAGVPGDGGDHGGGMIEDARRKAEQFAREVETTFGDDLVAAVLYGSVARGDYRPGVSDINTMIIVRNLGIDDVRRAVAVVRSWTAAGNPPPLMISEAEWRDSADVFPIEYSDI